MRLPSSARTGSRDFLLHPVMMDIALQTLGATRMATDLADGQTARETLVVPVRFAGVHVYGDITRGVCAVGSLAATDGSDRLVGEVVLTDPNGQPLLVIDEVEMAVLGSGSGATELTDRLFTLEWEPAPLVKAADAPAGLLLIGDLAAGDPLLPALQSTLGDRIAEVELVSPNDEAKLRAAITRTDIGWDGIVVVCPPRSADESLPNEAQLELAQARTLLIARVVETVTRMGARKSPRLWIVTRGAAQLDPDCVSHVGADGASWHRTGADIRAFGTEAHAAGHRTDGTGSLADLTEELLAGSDQDEVAYRDGQRYVNRLVPAPTTAKGELAGETRRTVVNLDGTASCPAADRSNRSAGRTDTSTR